MSNNWYRNQQRFDKQARASSEHVLGPEREAFAEAMAVVATCLDTVRASRAADLPTKRKIALTTHAFNLLWSAWDAALAGRYDAAANHWRSINETSDLLLALFVDPSFADRMRGRKEDVRSARRVIRDGSKKLGANDAKQWLTQRQRTIKSLNPFSHVSFEATGMALGIGIQDGKKIGVLRPGGVPAKPTLKLSAGHLAYDAVDLSAVTSHAFGGIVGINERWRTRVRVFGEEAIAAVRRELDGLDIPPGEIQKIILLRSDEEPPDPALVGTVIAPEVNDG